VAKYWFQKPRFVRKRPAITIRTYILWFIIGSMGAHRFYLGFWRSGLVYVAYLIVTSILEFGILEKMTSVPWEVKQNISYGFTGFLWFVLFIDVFLIRGLIDKANQKFSNVEVF